MFREMGVNMKRILSIKLTLIVFFMTMYIPCANAGWSPMTSGTTNNLSGIWGSSGSDVFAVGSGGAILHYNGSTWSAMSSGTTQTLNGVWGSSETDVFAVGSGGTILHYNGSTWSAMSSGTAFPLYGVWGSSGTDVFAVGDDSYWDNIDIHYYKGIILHYNGSTWSTIASGTAFPLYGVWGSAADDVFAVGGYWETGFYCTCGLCRWQCRVYYSVRLRGIKHFNGTSWSEITSSNDELYGGWGSSGSDVFAVGNGGTIAHYDGSVWSAMASGTAQQLNGVWGSSGSDVLAVGNGGTIAHYDGSAWSAMASGTAQRLNGVWGSSGNDVFAVGVNGTILHYDGIVPPDTTTVPTTTISTTTTVPPTVVSLIDFDAISGNRMVTLFWSTASEIDNAGFNLYRAESENGKYTKINATLIPAQGSSTQGVSYEFTDNDVQNRKTYYYKLEDIALNGNSTMHGPVSATPRLIYGIGK